VEVHRIDLVVHHVVEWVLRVQRVPSALVGYGLTLTLTLWPLMAQMEAMFVSRYRHETDQLVEDDCMIHCEVHPVQWVALLAVQCCWRDSPAAEANHEIFLDSFEEEIDVKVGILYDIVGMAQAGYRIDCVEHNRESEAQIQLN
jgi:hypothetical protein